MLTPKVEYTAMLLGATGNVGGRILHLLVQDVSADGEEVFAISDGCDVVCGLCEQSKTIELRGLQVRREHVRSLGGHHEYVPSLQPERRPLALDGEPARTLHDRGKLDLLRWRECERPGPSRFQGPDPDAARARQREDVCQGVAFHSHTMSQMPSTIKGCRSPGVERDIPRCNKVASLEKGFA
jgi:hypothetical protein